MPITDSRLKVGVLTLDSIAFDSQSTNVRLEPKTAEQGDAIEVLSGETITPDDETTWQLVIVAIQDFDDSEGFQAFSLDRAGDLVAYSWKPNAAGPTFTGTVRVRPVPIGGDVASRLSVTAEWPCEGAPTPSWPA